MIDIQFDGLPPEYMLYYLYVGTAPQGMGIFSAMSAPTMTIDLARKILAELIDKRRDSIRFDYLYGRPIKVTMYRDGVGDTWLYDRDAGDGAARHAFNNAVEAYTSGVAL